MNDINEWLACLAAPRRNHFFFGKMMGVAQFEQEQRYNMGQRWLVNRLSLGTGILCGLTWQINAEKTLIVVEPGVAIDAWGREIVVPLQVTFDFAHPPLGCSCGASAPITAPGRYFVCLSYCECKADAKAVEQSDNCSGLPECDYDTTIESFTISLKPFEEPEPSPFDCDNWLAPVIARNPPIRNSIDVASGKRVGDSSRLNLEDIDKGARAPKDGVARPPQVRELGARLSSMLKTDCPCPPGDTCVILGVVELGQGKAGDPLAIEDYDSTGRVNLYSQSQLLEMILCLAGKLTECCDTKPEEPPVQETLRVTNVELVGSGSRSDANIPADVWIALLPHSGSNPPSYAHAAVAAVRRLALRVTFNQPVDSSSLPLALLNAPGPFSVNLVGPPAADPTNPVSLQVSALLPNANVLMIFEDAKYGGLEIPGQYALELFGSDVATAPAHAALRSWAADPSQSHILDGLPSTLPSGDGHDGGDFEFKFVIEPADISTQTMFLKTVGTQDTRPVAVFPEVQHTDLTNLSVTRSSFGLHVILHFSQLPKEADWAKGIVVTSSSVPLSVSMTVAASDPLAVSLRGQVPDQAKSVEVQLLGSVLRSTVDDRYFDGDSNASSPLTLPTGNGQPGGDFTFSIRIP